MNAPTIRYVTRAQIDVQKWDQCIASATNGLIFAFSFYLDRMSKNWDALILDDYKAVMPITWNRKAGIYYLYQPALTPSLGIFGNHLDDRIVTDFLLSIPERFKLIEISLNAGNEIKKIPGNSFELLKRKNQVLSLQPGYDQIRSLYNDNVKRNIKKAVSLGCIVGKNIPIEQIISLVKDQFKGISNLQQDLDNFRNLYLELSSRNQAETYGILHKDQLLSGAVYFFSHKRAYYILVGNHPNGKTMGSSHYLVDRFIADHAGKDLLLDFEGSDISSLAFFYSSFGAQHETFNSIRLNRLPWYVKLFK